ALDQFRGTPVAARNDEDRVVAGDRTHDFRQPRAVDGHGERLRLPGAGPDDDQLLDSIDRPEELGGSVLERTEGGFGICGVSARPLIGTVAGALDQAEVADVAGDGRLRRLEAVAVQQAPQLLLAMQRLVVDQLEDDALPARFHVFIRDYTSQFIAPADGFV